MDVPAPSRPLRIIGVPDPRPLDPPPISHLPLLHETAMALAHLKALRASMDAAAARRGWFCLSENLVRPIIEHLGEERPYRRARWLR